MSRLLNFLAAYGWHSDQELAERAIQKRRQQIEENQQRRGKPTDPDFLRRVMGMDNADVDWLELGQALAALEQRVADLEERQR